MRNSEVEQLFLEDIRDKKRTGNGIHSRTGKRGYVGKMLFPFELGTSKDRRAYKKAGKVKVTNLYDEIIPKEEFLQLDQEQQKNRLKHWRSLYKIKEIQKGMGVSGNTFYKYIDQLGIEKAESFKGKGKAAQPEKTIPATREPTPAPQEPAIKPPEPQQSVLILNGLNIAYNGIYKAEQIRKMFTKLDIILDSEESEFEIELIIKEHKGAKRP